MNKRLLIPLLVGLLMMACDLSGTPQPTIPAESTITATDTLTATGTATSVTPDVTVTLTPTEETTLTETSTPASAPSATATAIPTPTQGVLSGDVNVTIQGVQFDPAIVTIRAGSTIHWTNNSDTAYTISADDGSFQSPTLQKGDQFAFTFATAGTIPYHCGSVTLIKGSIIVVP